MPSLRDIQSAARVVNVEPFDGFQVEVHERLATNPEIEIRARQKVEELATAAEKNRDAAYDAIAAYNREATKPDAEEADRPKAKRAKPKTAAEVEAPEPEPVEPEDPMAGIDLEQRRGLALIQVQITTLRNALENNPRMDLCTAIAARVKAWDLTDGPVKKVPIGTPEDLYHWRGEDGEMVSSDLLQGILKGLDEAPLIPKASR